MNNKDLVQRWYHTHEPGKLDEGAALVTADFRAYGLAPQPLDAEGFKHMGAMFIEAFSDVEQTFDEQVAEGDWVASRGTWQGTHTAAFQGIPPTGKRITMTWMGFDRLVDGKVAEHWAQLDLLGVLQQLGVIPMPETVAG